MKIQEIILQKYFPIDVNSPSFKAWFKNSVVCHKDGTPRVMYHAATVNFNYFDINRGELGQHFGNQLQANVRADVITNHWVKKYPRVIPVYLSIQHPLRLKDTNTFDVLETTDQLYEKGIISEELANEIDKNYGGVNKSKKIKQQGMKLLRKIIKKKGYDGIIYNNKYEARGVSYIIFSQYQVKSALSNTGKFNSRTRKITEGKLGPHAGKEVEMMIAGTKPAALISPKEKLLLNPYIKSGNLVSMQQYKNVGWIVAQKNEAWRLEKIYNLLKKKDEEWDEFGPDPDKPRTLYHATLGRLLGYAEDDINKFLNYVELKRQKREDDRIKRVQLYYSNITERIAPHGNPNEELKLMISGKKPAWLISSDQTFLDAVPYIKKYGWNVKKISDQWGKSYIITRKDGEKRAERIYELISDMHKCKIPNMIDYHRELGKLFGYDDRDIEFFIDSQRARGYE
jgi:hypothetical protein